MLRHISLLLAFVFCISHVYAQQTTPIDDLKRGARILAYQFHHAKESHKAKTMAKFLTIIDEGNEKNEHLIKVIKNDQKIYLESKIEDDGMAYSEFLLDLIKILPDNDKTKEKKAIGMYICSVLNPKSPAVQLLPREANFSQFYSDLFEGGPEGPEPPVVKMSASEVMKTVVIDSMNYNPTEFLDAINLINYKLRNTGTQINIESEKIKVDFVDEDEGYKVMNGPRVQAKDKTIFFKNTPLAEILKYIEHTTWLSYSVGQDSIDLVDAQPGENGRPEFFKLPETLLKDIQESVIRSRAKYDNKTMQIKGNITQIKDAGAQFYLELNNVFVIVINKANMKPDSAKIITERFNKYAQAKKDGMIRDVSANSPYVEEIVVRGKCLIKKINQIYINDCYSVLAEQTGHFYTK